MAMIGYARKSTTDQKLDLQIDALKSSGCERIFSDSASGSTDDRTGLKAALDFLQGNDVLVVWKLDRLGRSLTHLVETVGNLGKRGIGFRSLTEAIDTTSPGGRLIFGIFASLAEFERSLIISRTRAGLLSAKARGRVGGRPVKMSDKTIATARRLLTDPGMRTNDVCQALSISRSTLYRHMIAKPGDPSLPTVETTQNLPIQEDKNGLP
jgi:DNA invertase Pin-like site-specific DNA recombinase